MREYVLVKKGEEMSFIKRAEELEISELVLIYDGSSVIGGRGLGWMQELQDETSVKLIKGTIGMKKYDCEVVLSLGTIFNGYFPGMTHVGELEELEKKDGLHQRRSGLNHVILAQFKEKNVGVLFSYSLVQQSDVLGRMMQNVMLCKKAGVSVELVSLARDPMQMRHPRDVAALGRILGL